MTAPVLRVDPADPTPPFEQLRRQLSTLIATGVLAGGRRLPPVRQLAADLRLSPGTVARTYRELEQAGLVETGRSAGTRVRDGIATGLPDGRRGELDLLIDELLTRAHALGATDEDIAAALSQRLRAAER